MLYGAIGTSITITNHFSKVVADLSENDLADVTPKWKTFALIAASPRPRENIRLKPERTALRQNGQRGNRIKSRGRVPPPPFRRSANEITSSARSDPPQCNHTAPDRAPSPPPPAAAHPAHRGSRFFLGPTTTSLFVGFPAGRPCLLDNACAILMSRTGWPLLSFSQLSRSQQRRWAFANRRLLNNPDPPTYVPAFIWGFGAACAVASVSLNEECKGSYACYGLFFFFLFFFELTNVFLEKKRKP